MKSRIDYDLDISFPDSGGWGICWGNTTLSVSNVGGWSDYVLGRLQNDPAVAPITVPRIFWRSDE